MNKETLPFDPAWGKTFAKSSKVDHQKVSFYNRFGIALATDLYQPKELSDHMPAIAVCGPFGAVKEQASGLYAQTLAERSFITIAFDPSFTGKSGGNVRNVASPDINTEDFCAAVDFLSALENVDPQKIDILGICDWDGLALNAAAIDTRIKATVTTTMYDMCSVNTFGYFDSMNREERYQAKESRNMQRTTDYQEKTYQRAGSVIVPLPADAPFFV